MSILTMILTTAFVHGDTSDSALLIGDCDAVQEMKSWTAGGQA